MDIHEAAENGWLSMSQAARLLGLSTARVRQLISDGQLRAERTVLGRLVDPASLNELMEQRRAPQ
jgi:excisionase family DNA binding protein